MIDADWNSYKLQWQEIKCEVCSNLAKGTPFENKPVCYTHWWDFNTVEKEAR